MNIRIRIGSDKTIDEPNDVYVEAVNGEVCITGTFDGWMGFAVLADFDDAAEGEALARRIEANPRDVLESLGYDCGWMRD